MTVLRTLLLGCLLAVLACAAVAAPQAPTTAAAPGQGKWFAHPGAYGPAPVLLAHQYVTAEKPEDKKEFRKKLSDEVSKEFDAHIKQQQKELEDLDKQIANLRAVLKKRLDAKATIVERRAEQLIQEAEGLGWNAPSSPPAVWGRSPGPAVGTLPIQPGQPLPK